MPLFALFPINLGFPWQLHQLKYWSLRFTWQTLLIRLPWTLAERRSCWKTWIISLVKLLQSPKSNRQATQPIITENYFSLFLMRANHKVSLTMSASQHHVRGTWRPVKNNWLIFILCNAQGLCWRAFSLSESVWITPLCAATHGRRLEMGG